jgi:hypothetical protein
MVITLGRGGSGGVRKTEDSVYDPDVIDVLRKIVRNV